MKFLKILKSKELKTTLAYKKLGLSSRKCNNLKDDLILTKGANNDLHQPAIVPAYLGRCRSFI